MKATHVLILSAFLFGAGCGPSDNANSLGDGSPHQQSQTPSPGGDWVLTQKSCPQSSPALGKEEGLSVGAGASAFAFVWTEEVASQRCRSLDGYLFTMLSAGHSTDSDGNNEAVQTGSFQLIETKQRCWHLKNGQPDGDPFVDRTSDTKGPRLDGEIRQSSNNELRVHLASSAFYSGGESDLTFTRNTSTASF